MYTQHAYLDALKLLTDFCENKSHFQLTDTIAQAFADAFKQGNKILACGNGGSACDAIHLCEEFTGQYRKYRRALPAISLTDVAHITCVGNDFGFNEIFARGVEAFGQANDWLVVLSTSGNSANIIRAVEVAKQQSVRTFALLGKDGGKLKGMCDYEIIVPGTTSDRIQEIHMMILHIIIEGVERRLFPENYTDS